MFAAHSVESAPPASRPAMRATAEAWGGTVPDAVARLATSPELLNGFLSLSASFERCTLDPLSREVVIMTVAARNECHLCLTLHTGKLRALGAETALITALREERTLPDERLDALRTFTLDVLATTGAVPDDSLDALLTHGYTERNALEVVMGIGTYTLSTFANRLVRAA
ncbi:carboxymuconolactone decarboxylase family protein [Streptomyces sp. RS10V-4]|uniref:carboxymuconolactone decarboxylase family protein n=1 Tax=Streptomyces rhizoryzae TaxID=2932493 RepID=UPI002004027E|nr:carboxymuconolactone decarboxylase family protein [Streptomyces rhizoryzae]MCK7626630.1 carboxymuconolactone decarboxylase family protein [Streptomyces rhizoryzae]